LTIDLQTPDEALLRKWDDGFWLEFNHREQQFWDGLRSFRVEK